MIYIGGFSGGVDSQAAARYMLNRYGPENVVLLNTDAGGNEHPLTIQFTDDYSVNVHAVTRVQAIRADIWDTPGFAETKGMDSNAPLDFPTLAKIKGRWPSSGAQFCTDKLKLRPIRRWLRQHYPDGNYIRFAGVRRDESHSRAETPYTRWDEFFDTEVMHPVFDWTKQMCFDYVKAHGEPVNPLYALGFNRVGCAPCIYSGKDDILNWARRFPEMIDKVRGWEQQTGRTFFAPKIPGKPIWIDEVVEWAKTGRGGKQMDMFRVLNEVASCESKFGLCE